jgi:hypothetical protein
VELTAGAVQITTMPPSGNDTMVARLRPEQATDGSLQFTTSVPSIHVKWRGQRLQPALSPWLDDQPHERFAYLTVPDVVIPGQPAAAVLTAGDLTGATGEQAVWKGTAELPVDAPLDPDPMASPTIPHALAFTADGSAIAVRYGTQVAVVPLKDPAQTLKFSLPRLAAPGVAASSRPLMAAVRMAPAPGQPVVWRFALLDTAGVVILESNGGNGNELRVYGPAAEWAPTLIQGSLQGSNGAARLRFSGDGGLLTLQQFQRGVRDATLHHVRVWDLRTTWSATIKAARDDATLTTLVCERAVIDPAGRALLPDERITSSAAASAGPCPAPSAPNY